MKSPSPGMRRALRQARLYGHLLVRNDRLYHPGGNHPICSIQLAREMVRSGWMTKHDGEYEITAEGQLAAESELGR
ncbi:hypothetical protein I6F14_17595 [Bradyrhizobium sp. IC3069]|uniref:Uncharacterized protein n=2 Tax=Nitrobacteraceae TaxID=41294 RepID=A0A0R3C6D1_9BRAD|nr:MULTISPECIES: hypothetical protein [Bradyrhizobium]MCA1414954.1 hypothetical protein [Bradyrhizobium sp. NBAIM20]MCA1474327.1 hypothetical protein [Bradyrhizobium sp. NBAIM08]MCA1497080.1 hypothetical protein [Bradyrhizobium sp. NBAIM14]MCA1534168.1 hypothetical protein [Bradyrhizobium sp. NBAIM03]KRP90756.1 hypothetical protein AOQ72_33795 [Bradyrhizobium yuanmingense]